VRWSVDNGSALVQFHPAPEHGLYPDRRVDPLQVGVLDVLLDFAAELDEGLLLGGALPRGFELRANAADDLAGLLEDGVTVEVIEVPAGGAGLLGELPLFPVEGGNPASLARLMLTMSDKRPTCSTATCEDKRRQGRS
jgi:hypothetical protein